MEKLKTTHEVKIRWHAFELRPAGSPPIPEYYLQRIMAARPRFEQAARAHYGLEIKAGKFGINTHQAHIAAHYAEQQGKGAAYHDALLRAYWLEARDISEVEVLVEIGVTLGLDAESVRAALSRDELDVSVNTDIYQARALGLDGVPALIFARKYLVSGAQPYEVLANVVEQIQAKAV